MAPGKIGGITKLEDRPSRRLILAYKLAALAIVVIALCWGAVFVTMQWWWLAAADLGLALVGAASWLLIHQGRLAVALIISQLAFLAFAVMFCMVFDVPSDTVPRVSHLYLLTLAMLGYINYLRKRSNVQLVVIGLCLAAFIAFASAKLSVPFAQPISDDFRLVGAWINVTFAVVMLCCCIHVVQVQFARTTTMARELQQALLNREFTLYYQPQVDCAGNTLGAEALLRWTSPKRGFVSPGDFIPMAEQAGLMTGIGGWVLAEACRTLADWAQDPARCNLTLSVNVSASQFHEIGFEETVFQEVASHRLDATKLKLELTESVMVADMEAVIAKMHRLRAAGIVISLDDFGTGYSSLDYLRRLPLNQLKMDRSFIQDVVENKRSASLARNILQLGRDLDIAVLAEGVETQEQFRFLLDNGCAEFQGFLFGRPVPRAEFELRPLEPAAAA